MKLKSFFLISSLLLPILTHFPVVGRATSELASSGEQSEAAKTPPPDPVYSQLREIGFSGEMATVANVELKRDAGRFRLRQGTFYFFSPVKDRVIGAVFVGQGRFHMRPPTQVDRNFLRHFLENAEDPTQVNEPFEQLILYFTDTTYDELKAKLSLQRGSVPDLVTDLFKDHQRELRRELRQTIELRLLADLYNPARVVQAGSGPNSYRGIFTAFIKGQKFKKLIYQMDPLGVVPILLSPEEVGLISYDRDTAGIWSLFHYEDEYTRQTASSDESHLEYDITHVRIESTIDRGEQLTASAQITLTPKMPGLRVLQFALYPRLRVSRVTDATGAPLPFIQADHEEGGAFAVIYPQPLPQQPMTLTIEYRGPEAIQDSGGGNYLLNPAARDTWYPNNWQATFGDRATFDLTFHIPPNLQLIATGKKVREWKEDKDAASQWVSDYPLAVAGFNYGDFRALEKEDNAFNIAVFTNKDEPNEIKEYRQAVEQIEREQEPRTPGISTGGTPIDLPLGNLSTAGLANSSLVEAINSIRIYNRYFGVNPYARLVMSQQPVSYFGQSWPMLVYMPYIAFLDSTQRRALGIPTQVFKFTDIVGPHEIAHQWWGHLVSWKTYHDQWLSEGFAEFSASLYLQWAYHKDPQKRYDRYLKFWEEVRNRVIEKVPLGAKLASMRPNDVGPIWLGARLDSSRTGGAYNYLIYSKGAFVLQMLRMMMRDAKAQAGEQDARFIAMMRDFVQTHLHQSASTEDFKRIVEKHMTPDMDLDGNGRMDWFFNQWVYGTDLPHYKLEYGFGSAPDGKTLLRIAITQSSVSPDFKMLIPIYLDFGKGTYARLGDARITGNSSESAEIPLLEKPKAVKLCANYDVLSTIEEVKTK
ncbi:MAG: hypothetical protein HY314_04270 [Acidobacteria bacterium]|nr:hypothetical protein [Acidobacteriota bacterium]